MTQPPEVSASLSHQSVILCDFAPNLLTACSKRVYKNQPHNNQKQLQDKNEFLIKISINMPTQMRKPPSKRDTCLSPQQIRMTSPKQNYALRQACNRINNKKLQTGCNKSNEWHFKYMYLYTHPRICMYICIYTYIRIRRNIYIYTKYIHYTHKFICMLTSRIYYTNISTY